MDREFRPLGSECAFQVLSMHFHNGRGGSSSFPNLDSLLPYMDWLSYYIRGLCIGHVRGTLSWQTRKGPGLALPCISFAGTSLSRTTPISRQTYSASSYIPPFCSPGSTRSAGYSTGLVSGRLHGQPPLADGASLPVMPPLIFRHILQH
jgi:hypothetical protein